MKIQIHISKNQDLTVVIPFCGLLQLYNTLNDFRIKFDVNFDQIIS